MDRWEGTVPSEDAAQAWAAIDALAQRYVRDGVCERIDRARAKALTDLVEGHATIKTVVTLTVPAEALLSADVDGSDLVEVGGLAPGEPVLVERAWLEQAITRTRAVGRDGRVRLQACDRATGAGVGPVGELSTGAYRPGTALAALVKARDGRCRFPGCHVAARFCDLDHVTP